MVLVGRSLPRVRDAALVGGAVALAAAAGAIVVSALTSTPTSAPILDQPTVPGLHAPFEQPAPADLSAPPGLQQVPSTARPSAAPVETPRAVPERKVPETAPLLTISPSFRPGGYEPPPEPRIPPQD